ncbi:MAG: efflux RND transporter periplasmic adaptor subunit [Kofleriaceae bacterium]
MPTPERGSTRGSFTVALCAATILVGCERVTPTAPLGVAVKVATPERSSTMASARYTAQIVPGVRVDLAFKVGGYVESIAQVAGVNDQPRPLQEGDLVEAGAQLASLRESDYDQKVAEARAAVSQAASTYRDARRDAARDAKLARVGSLPPATADSSRARRDAAAAATAGARARLAQAKTARSDATLVAPLSGVILKRAIEVGSLATPGTVAFTIADVTKVKAAFGVPDLLLPRIKLGDTLRVTTDAFPGVTFEGQVSRLAPEADQRSRVFDVDVTIPNPDNKLKAGMVASLAIDTDAAAEGNAEDLPLVPLSAIVRPRTGKGFAVYVVEAAGGVTRARAREVTLGDYLGRVVPIKKGLGLTERVVVQGAGLLADGERVEVIP